MADHDKTVTVIDGKSGTVVATVPVGEIPLSVAVDPGAHAVFVSQSDGKVSVIDTTSRTVITDISLDALLGALAVDPTTHTLYAADGSGVAKIDTISHAVTGKIQWTYNAGIAMDPGANALYVTSDDTFDAAVDVIDTVSGSITDRPRVGKAPRAVAVDPVDHTVYVTNDTDGTVSVITR